MALLALFVHFVAGWLLVLMADLAGTWNYDRTREMHWTERARLLWPVRAASETNLILVPLLLHMAHGLFAPGIMGSWVLNDTSAFLGASVGGYWLDRMVFPWLRPAHWRALVFGGMLSRFLTVMIPVFVGLAMPVVPGWPMLLLTASYLLFQLATLRGAGYKLLMLTGHVRDARARLVTIVEEASAEVGIPAPRVRELRSAGAQAYALVARNELLFTDRVVDVCSDPELKAICHHELAHLTEPTYVRHLRYVSALSHFPLLFVTPLVHSLGAIGFIIAMVAFIALRSVLPKVSRTMEKRADRVAVRYEATKGVFAQALLRIHQANLIPAVTRHGGTTHPHLYDRLVDAGLVPDFARPVAPSGGTSMMHVYSVLLGMAVMWLLVHPEV